uniref:Uncharacterized protein n=1 Tax=Glossina pallidipes TaxID=7398 RepID=A0A1A9Z9L6_GLOPL
MLIDRGYYKSCGIKIIKISIRIALIDLIIYTLIIISECKDALAQPYRQTQRCSTRLENALEHMRRRSFQKKTNRSYEPSQTPYSLYHELYSQRENINANIYDSRNERHYPGGNQRPNNHLDFMSAYSSSNYAQHDPDINLIDRRTPHKLVIKHVDVEDLKVRLPSTSMNTATHWVQVDKCKFSSKNSTLDTRLIFPDLMLSGKVILQPSGGKCNMILRLRHAGIEFRTVPIGYEKVGNEETSRLSGASVRTDSHFTEPGFISVFAHGCQGPTGIKVRRNSRRHFGPNEGKLSTPWPLPAESSDFPYDIPNQRNVATFVRNLDENGSDNLSKDATNFNEFYNFDQNDSQYRRARRQKKLLEPFRDELNFDDDVLNVSDEKLQDLVQPDARAFAVELLSRQDVVNDVNDALSNELEKLFSLGVRGLLTTYMQKALQPAIKETLMENMGYTLSYG